MSRVHAPATRSEDDRRALIGWAVACARRVLPAFETDCPDDARPRDAIEGGVAWMEGESSIGAVRALALASHAAAREAHTPAAVAAARSAGHAAAVAHMAGHARKAAQYALQSIKAREPDRVGTEDVWQRSTVPSALAAFVYPEDD